jgi:hypothetical protein
MKRILKMFKTKTKFHYYKEYPTYYKKERQEIVLADWLANAFQTGVIDALFYRIKKELKLDIETEEMTSALCKIAREIDKEEK